MIHRVWGSVLLTVGMIGIGVSVPAIEYDEEKPVAPSPPVPLEYAYRHMPSEYWGNPEIIDQGRAIYIGAEYIDVNCVYCHGRDGKPVKARTTFDFRQREHMAKFSDSQWFWRISEGWGRRRATQRHSWKAYLSEDERWKVIAYALTFSLKGMKYDVAKGMWVNAAAVPYGEAIRRLRERQLKCGLGTC